MQVKIKYEGMVLRTTYDIDEDKQAIQNIRIAIRRENTRDIYYDDRLSRLLTFAANIDYYQLYQEYAEELEKAQLRFYGDDTTIILGDKQSELRKGQLLMKCSYEYWDNTQRINFTVERRDGEPFKYDPQIPIEVQDALRDWDYETTVIAETQEEKLFKISLKDVKRVLAMGEQEVEL